MVWHIHPNNVQSRHFDILVTFALIFTTIVTPYEVALLQTRLNIRFVVNCCVDCVYLVDMFRHFFLAYETNSGVLIVSPVLIMRRYLRSWFFIDLLSVIPYDGLSLALGSSEKLKTVKIIRLMRLLKLAKMLNGSALWERYKAELSISLSMLSLFKNCLKMVIVSHWFACAWILIAMLECDHDCMLDEAAVNAQNEAPSWLHRIQFGDGGVQGPGARYIAGVYWAAATLTSVGYGDIAAINPVERGFSVMFLFASGLIWASIIGNICGIMATLDINGIEFAQMFDQVSGLRV
jgi:hypothetical protein